MTIRNILVPFDFSSGNTIAIEHACALGEQMHANIHLVYVLSGGQNSDLHRQAMERLMSALPPSFELQNKVFREVLYGNVVHELLNYATTSGADLIVMETRGRSGLAQIAYGSVAQQVLKGARCPVVLVKEEMKHTESTGDDASNKYETLKASESPAIDLLARAISLRASDVHIDPLDASHYSIRFRIDGKLHNYCSVDLNVVERVMHQYLTLARMDLADPFRPREGRLILPVSMRDTEVRITATPVAGGNAMALRLFSKENVFMPLESLGFSETELSKVQQMIRGAEGLLLVTGPAGSGKTTSVYSMLHCFGGESRNIVSIEDPVEFDVPFVRQLNVDEKHAVTMTNGLSTLLRMDPDVIFVGEIRDPEAAMIALRAANSGRFVFSSLHTRDVASTLTALRDLGITNHSIAGNLIGVVNQRLLRRLCEKCRSQSAPSEACKKAFSESGLPEPVEVYEPVGCDSCRGTGYRGRCGIFEAAIMDGELSQAISDDATEAELRRLIRMRGIQSLSASALSKVQSGITSFEEAMSARWM